MSENIETLIIDCNDGANIAVDPIDNDNDIFLYIEKDINYISTYISIDQAKQLITFLNKQIENGNQKTN